MSSLKRANKDRLEATRLETTRSELVRLEARRLDAATGLDPTKLDATTTEAIRLEATKSELRRLEDRRLEAIRAFEADANYVGEGRVERRRFEEQDLIDAVGPVEDRGKVVAYVCGPPPMTDWAVEVLKGAEGMGEERVLCEKWW